ncbi:XRE family transcriptional regulator [Pseudomonas putida]|uniref:helix-turn-helix domain-containing protein n=1 Tax=Pseudomonas putida TaxID=303 RepID=UPI000F766BDD|nr:helix-turn-helix transcriptional regulator [Pseudomonas putida]RSC25932.1 XRE family transcriptional regulator [Pseudomonas putida]
MDYNQAFGSVFRALRRQRGLTQEAFQPAATERYIRHIEKGEYSPSIAMIRQLCEILKISPGALVILVEAQFTGQDLEELIATALSQIKGLQ